VQQRAGWAHVARGWLGAVVWATVAVVAEAAPLQQEPAGAAPVAAAASQPAGATRWLAGPAGSALPLEEALAKARDGDIIELLSGEYRGAWLIEGRRLTLRGMGGDKPAVLRGDGKPGATKALLTVRGGEVTLQGIEFAGARNSEGGGAGVRLEGGGRLLIKRCRFFDNEYGLFATNDDKAELRIEDSVFGQAPRIEGGLYHLVNVGRIARLAISGSRFQQGFEGHLIKSRARENLITYNFIHDGLRGGASYEIDIANGGLTTIVGNVIGQGSESQNLVVVAYGTEDRSWDRNRLVVAHNTFVNHGWVPGWFLRVFTSKLPPGTEVVAVNNLLVGGGVFSMGATGRFEGNHHALRRMLRDADTQAFELAPGSSLRDKGVDPRSLGVEPPQAEFDWPVGVKPLPKDLKSWTPGAYQN
jgi:Right handed beta helix region